MRIHIKLHIKLLLLSLALVIALIALTGVIFYHYNAQSARQSAEAELATLAEKLSLQMEARIQQIDVAFLFMLSDPEFLSALSSYTMPRRDDARNRLLVSDSVTALGRVLRSYAVGKHFRRVVMFDLQGHYFTSDYSARARPGGAFGDRSGYRVARRGACAKRPHPAAFALRKPVAAPD
ncbi:MAG: hypothetical protein RR739_03675, partial [Clostridia bacterium]